MADSKNPSHLSNMMCDRMCDCWSQFVFHTLESGIHREPGGKKREMGVGGLICFSLGVLKAKRFGNMTRKQYKVILH